MKKWIFDLEKESIINIDRVDYFFLDCQGDDYTKPHRVLAESEHNTWLLFESDKELAAKTFLKDLEMKLNSTKCE